MFFTRRDYETVKVSSFGHSLSLLIYNLDHETMRVMNTVFLHDDTVQKRLEEISALGLAAIPVIDIPVSDCVGVDGCICRMSDLLLSSDGKDTIIDTPITWTDTAPRYHGDNVTPLRFGTVSKKLREQIHLGLWGYRLP